MFTIILFLIVGGFMVYVAQDNLLLVPLHIGTYTITDIPLFYIIIGSLLTGLGFAYLIYTINAIFTAFSIHKKDNKIKQSKNEIAELTKQIHKLEIENEKLKQTSSINEPQDKNAL